MTIKMNLLGLRPLVCKTKGLTIIFYIPTDFWKAQAASQLQKSEATLHNSRGHSPRRVHGSSDLMSQYFNQFYLVPIVIN